MILNPAWMASSPVARLLVAGLVVAAAGMLVQYGSGVGNGFTPQLSDPGAFGGFAGTLVQIAGLVVAVAAGIVAVRSSIGARATTSPTAPTA